MLAILAPGQGSQTPGQLAPWLQVTGAEQRLRWWSQAAGIDLIAAGTTWTAEQIRDTAVAQPLLVATSLLAAEALLVADGQPSIAGSSAAGTQPLPAVVTGHSVGEITAAALAGALPAETALLFIRARGAAMARAAATTPTGMSAVLGGDPETVVRHLGELGLTPANRNGAGQIVAAGALPALQLLQEHPPAKARVRPLQVAGAFHTDYMRPARDELASIADGLRAVDPRSPLVSNADGGLVGNGRELLRRLVAQVAAPVRFDLCLRTLAGLGVTSVIELAPAGTLAGLVKRELDGVSIVRLSTPDDLPAARALVAAASGGCDREAAGQSVVHLQPVATR